MPTVRRSASGSCRSKVIPQVIHQQYLPGTPSALVLKQETIWVEGTPERERRVKVASERSEWHRKPSPYEYLPEPITPAEDEFRHAGWAVQRRKVAAALQRTAATPHRQERFRCCGSGCYVQRCVGESRVRLSANYCHDRFCLPCASARSRLIARNLSDFIGDGSASHLVLTLKHSDTPLAGQFDRLVKAFARLRAHKHWEARVKGGGYFFEVKRSKDGKFFHPHLHVVMHASYIDQRWLSETWLGITGDSDYVYIKAIADKRVAVSYAAKYASKPFDPSVLRDNDWLDQCVLALRGRRMCGCFGEWRGRGLEDDDPSDRQWVNVGRLDSIIRDAEGGSESCRAILAMISPKYANRWFPSADVAGGGQFPQRLRGAGRAGAPSPGV